MNIRQIITGGCIALASVAGCAKAPKVVQTAEKTLADIKISKDTLKGTYYLSEDVLNTFKQKYKAIDTLMFSGIENLPDSTQKTIKKFAANPEFKDTKIFVNANREPIVVTNSDFDRYAYQFDNNGKQIKGTRFVRFSGPENARFIVNYDEPHWLFREDVGQTTNSSSIIQSRIGLGDYTFDGTTGECINQSLK